MSKRRYAAERSFSDAVTSYHEAAHAVVATAVGRTVDVVRIDPIGEKAAGCHGTYLDPRTPTADQLRADAVWAVAGATVEKHVMGVEPDPARWRSDRLQVTVCDQLLVIEHGLTESFEDFTSHVQADAVKILEEKRQKVEQIATVLQEDRSLIPAPLRLTIRYPDAPLSTVCGRGIPSRALQ